MRSAAEADDDLAILAVIPTIEDNRNLTFLQHTAAWVMSRAQQEKTAHSLPFDEVVKRPHSRFSEAILDMLDKLGPPPRGRPVGDPPWSILLTANRRCIGKTTIAVNLAQAAIREGLNALLVEGRQDAPRLAELIDPEDRPGLTRLGDDEKAVFHLARSADVALKFCPILPSGNLIVRRIAKRSDTICYDAKEFDLVIVDGSTLDKVSTIENLLEQFDGIGVVVSSDDRKTVSDSLQSSVLHSTGQLGFVVSQARINCAI